MIQIKQGSIFDTKSDLIVIPCDSAGGVTSSVYANLKEHGLTTDIGLLTHGEVLYRRSTYEFANIIEYAASVNYNNVTSDSVSIGNIASSIAGYSRENNLGAVNIPLLGSGAGGLSPIASFKALQKGLGESANTMFNIFCLTEEAYSNVISIPSAHGQAEMVQPPRVFISYASNDGKNVEWVKSFAERLRSSGVNARVDLYHLPLGTDLPQWMANEVVLATKVLLICDRHYVQKAEG